MAFPLTHEAGALKMVGDAKLAKPLATAFDKCRDTMFPVVNGTISIPSTGTDTYIKDARIYAVQEIAKAFESMAAQNLKPIMIITGKKTKLKKNGQGYKDMLAGLTYMLTVKSLNPNYTEEMYNLDIYSMKYLFIDWIKKNYALKPPVKTLYLVAFPPSKG